MQTSYQRYLDLKRHRDIKPVRNLRNLKYQQLLEQDQHQQSLDAISDHSNDPDLNLAFDKLWVGLLLFALLVWWIYLLLPMYQVHYVLN